MQLLLYCLQLSALSSDFNVRTSTSCFAALKQLMRVSKPTRSGYCSEKSKIQTFTSGEVEVHLFRLVLVLCRKKKCTISDFFCCVSCFIRLYDYIDFTNSDLDEIIQFIPQVFHLETDMVLKKVDFMSNDMCFVDSTNFLFCWQKLSDLDSKYCGMSNSS